MNDSDIIKLYWERNEHALAETSEKYGHFCYQIAYDILSIREDSEECVNDTWYQTWNSIPPNLPFSLRAYLGKITRNLSLNLWKKNHAQKRYSGMDVILDELSECIPSSALVEQTIVAKELTALINTWLKSLKKNDRILFVRRYWLGKPVKELAEECGISEKSMALKLFRLRAGLKKVLEKEGVWL